MIKSVERSDSSTLVTLDHFSHFTLMGLGCKALPGATQSLALWAKILYMQALWISLTENASRTTPKMMRTVLPFNRSAIIRDPAWPPANEKIAATRMNFQSVAARLIWAINPLKEEKTTINMEVAAAILVGILRI